MLLQALVNLLANACQVSPADGVIRARCGSDGEGGVVFQVEDEGPGVSESDRPHLFEPFFSHREGGTGLGLAIVQKIADLHHGSVELQGRKQGGSCATLHIPRPTEAAERPDAEV
jgi:signal transduction histidine kinase